MSCGIVGVLLTPESYQEYRESPVLFFMDFSQDLKHAISYFNGYCVKHWPFIKNVVVIMINKFSTVVWFQRVTRK